jgi:uncharacterized protein (DUF885 family)
MPRVLFASRFFGRSLALPAAFVLLACTPAKSPSPPPPPPSFASFVDAHFAATFAYKPTRATYVGIHEQDTHLEDLSRARIEARISELKKELATLAQFDRSKLSFDDGIDREAIESDVRAELYDLDVVRLWERNPMLYAGLPGRSIDALMKRNFAPVAERVKSVTARLRAVPALYVAARANLRGTPAKEHTELALRMAKGSAKFLEKQVVEWARSSLGAEPPLVFLTADGAAANAAREFAAWLESDLLPKSTGPYALGKEQFLTKLKYEEMIDLPLDQLLARGQKQLDKDYNDFVATAAKIDPKKTPAEVMKSVSDDHPKEDELIKFVADSVEDARKFVVEKNIATVPSEVRPTVAETPGFARAATFASMDTPGPYEAVASEAFYYVTPVEKEWDEKHKEEHLRMFNRWVTPIINVHEAFPGHYLQFLYKKTLPTKTRKLVSTGSNGEGWAHYAEQMLVDEGFGGGDPRMRLAQLQEALVRDCRYVAGIQLHTGGWTVEQATKLFEEKSFSETANSREEARRGTYNPTYLYYTFGKLEIQALAAEYKAKKGGTLKDFHDAFVRQGVLAIPLVKKILFRS